MSKRSFFVIGVVLVSLGLTLALFWSPLAGTIAQIDVPLFGDEPDLPDFAKYKVDKEDFMLRRSEHIGMIRGIEKDKPFDPQVRVDAIRQTELLEAILASSRPAGIFSPVWTEIGPNPIPNAQVDTPPVTSASGRVISIAVHPTNPDIVYVGTAQGGLYRSTNGGTNWTRLMDGALSLAIGAVAIAPSDPETVYVGTGEGNFSVDSFFGVGVYRITNASSVSPAVSGPFNDDAVAADIFSGRAISEIIVHPTDPNTIFVASTSGIGGIGSASNNILPSRGIYRSTNATSASPVFNKLTGLAANLNASVRDIAIDPLNPNLMVANLVASAGTGGIYVSTDALAANPTFTQRVVFNSSSTSELTAEFAVQHTPGNPNPTIYAATGNLGGRVLVNTDGGGPTWTQQIDNNFCTAQCFYDIAIGVDPNNANNVFIGGSPNLVFGRSTDGGLTFTNDAATSRGLHVDSHAIGVSPSQPTTIYFGSDGGIYKTTDSGTNWTSLNNSEFTATQFMGIAIHPVNPSFSIGGTQDNGTNFYRSDRTWLRADFGDGGYAVIDQNATDVTNVRMYHTYFNSPTLQGYGTVANTASASDGNWTFRGCQSSGATVNGITCNGTILFYAPLEQGPGTPNTIYYGSDRLYRSADNGLNHTVVSQNPITPGVPISAIGISPQDDNVRIVGLANGGIFATTSGSAALTSLDPVSPAPGSVIPDNFVARAVIDPTNTNTAYVTLSGFGVVNVWKTTNLNAAPPTWTAVTSGLPQVPVNALVVDPQASNNVYVGTDIGAFVSNNGGANWAPFGTGLPRVAIFDMAIAQGNPRRLRIATHGRGMWEIPIEATQDVKFDYDGDGKTDISVFRPGDGNWHIAQSAGGIKVQGWGLTADRLAPADFDGDGRTDLAVFRELEGNWYIINSMTNTITIAGWGIPNDLPVPADFGGDGKADLVVYRPSTRVWWRRDSDGMIHAHEWGLPGDTPAPADFNGDSRADFVVFRPSEGNWYVWNSSDFSVTIVGWGLNGDIPLPADYSGDGRADFCVFRPSDNTWYRRNSNDNAVQINTWGLAGDLPVPGDYDGDGRSDLAVWRPSDTTWYLNTTTSGIYTQPFGLTGDKPTPNAFVY